ncbi:MAG: hypothetical protein K8T20_08215 [Planctomycetes bacterium]|nr:hypothetical protein [Planctomycetota bacterium]
MRALLLSLALAAAAFADDLLEKRYPELDAEDVADAKAIAALEDHVNGWFDEEVSEKRAAHLKALEAATVPFKVIEAIVRHGRRYEKPEETIVGNLTLPPKYDPARPTPVLVGLNGLADGWEREASIRGYITLYPWKVEAWQDPKTTDIVWEQLWNLSRRVNIDFDRLYCTGCSVGGHATWIAGIAGSDEWAAMLPVSGSPGRILVSMSEVYLANMHDLPCRATVGAKDNDIEEMAKKGQGIAKRFGIPAQLDVVDDREHESFDDRAEMLLAWSSELKRARYPAKLDYWGGADLGHRHYWVEVTEEKLETKELKVEAATHVVTRHIPVTPFHVTATLKGQEVSVYAKDAEEVRVGLSDGMLDMERDVTVRINGKVAWKGVPARTVKTLLESSARRQDRLRTFSWEHEFDLR